MNLTRMALVFVLITLPFMLISYVEVNGLQQRAQMKQQYTEIINNAIDDGASALKYTMEAVDKEGSHIDVEEVIEAFLASYHYGFNVVGEVDKIRVDQHILALVIMDYDGFYVYGTKSVSDPSGHQVLRPVLSEKHFYDYEDSQYRVHVTLDDAVTVIEKGTLVDEKGLITEISHLPAGLSVVNYEEEKALIIRNAVIEALNYTVSLHNRYTQQLGIAYDFYIPIGHEDAWASDIDNLGILAFIQGHPLGGGHYLDVMAFGKSEVVLEDRVMGYLDASGNLYYCDHTCSHVNTDTQVKIFASTEGAAREGYYPCHMVGK